MQMGFFDSHFAYRRFSACCDHLTSSRSHTDHSSEACSAIQKSIAQQSPGGKLPPFDRRPFTPALFDDALRDSSDLDPHQIGIPLNSFLSALSLKVGIQLTELYFPLFKLFSPENVTGPAPVRYTCSVASKRATFAPLSYQCYRFQDLFLLMSSRLRPEQQRVYDELWVSRRMDLAMQYADLSNDLRFRNRAASELWELTRTHEASYRLQLAECYDELLFQQYPSEGCRLRCLTDDDWRKVLR